MDTREVRQTDKDGVILGLSGRQLRVVSAEGSLSGWKNPSGEWRVGLLAGYGIFPRLLTARIKKDRREKLSAARRRHLAVAHEQDLAAKGSKAKAESAARVEVLEAKGADEDETGPVYDVLQWHDGEQWRGALVEVAPLESPHGGQGGVVDAAGECGRRFAER